MKAAILALESSESDNSFVASPEAIDSPQQVASPEAIDSPQQTAGPVEEVSIWLNRLEGNKQDFQANS